MGKNDEKRSIIGFFCGSKKISVREGVENYIKYLGPCPESTYWKIFLKNAQDYEYHRKLHKMYTELHNYVKKNTDFGSTIEARGKSLVSTEKKKRKVLQDKKSLDTIKDFIGFRVVIYSRKTEEEQIYDAHKLGISLITFFEGIGYIPCAADEAKENRNFNKKDHPDVVIPDENKIKNILGDYIGNFKNYNLHPKDNGYQALHILFKDEFGRYIELQIRTQMQDARANDDSAILLNIPDEMVSPECSNASHKKYKEKYDELPIDFAALKVNGVEIVGRTLSDFVGFFKSLLIYQNTIPDRIDYSNY